MGLPLLEVSTDHVDHRKIGIDLAGPSGEEPAIQPGANADVRQHGTVSEAVVAKPRTRLLPRLRDVRLRRRHPIELPAQVAGSWIRPRLENGDGMVTHGSIAENNLNGLFAGGVGRVVTGSVSRSFGLLLQVGRLLDKSGRDPQISDRVRKPEQGRRAAPGAFRRRLYRPHTELQSHYAEASLPINSMRFVARWNARGQAAGTGASPRRVSGHVSIRTVKQPPSGVQERRCNAIDAEQKVQFILLRRRAHDPRREQAAIIPVVIRRRQLTP